MALALMSMVQRRASQSGAQSQIASASGNAHCGNWITGTLMLLLVALQVPIVCWQCQHHTYTALGSGLPAQRTRTAIFARCSLFKRWQSGGNGPTGPEIRMQQKLLCSLYNSSAVGPLPCKKWFSQRGRD